MSWTLDRATTATRLSLLVAAALAVAGCAGSPTQTAPPSTTQTVALSSAGTPTVEEARTLLNNLLVKGRAPKTGYSRDLFGDSWSDDVDVAGGHNGCDTRNDILGRDLTGITHKPGTRDCIVLTGTLNDPYTGTVIDFVRGQGTSNAVQIDHVVALSDAWQKGAQQLDPRQRTNFANDPRNLLAVDGPANQQKSDSDAASWLPAKPYRCTYVSKQIEVKAAYNLWVTQAEKDAMTRILDAC